jgi:hypothetical protein
LLSDEYWVTGVHTDSDTHIVILLILSRYEGGVVYYHVDWVGYETPTWEPAANLAGAEKTIMDYEVAMRATLAEAPRSMSSE